MIALQSGLVIAFVLVLAGPIDLPDLLGLGPALTLGLAGLALALVTCVPQLAMGGTVRTRLDWPLVVYLAIVAATAAASVDRWSTLRAAVALAGQVALFYSVVAVARRAPWLAAAVAMAIAGAGAIVQLMALSFHAEVGFRIRPAGYPVPAGWSGYPELAALLTVQLGVLIAAVLAAQRPAARVVSMLVAGVGLVELLFLYSRTAWLAFVVMVAGTVVAVRPGRWKQAVLRTAAALVLVGAVAMAIPTVRALALALAGVRAPDVPHGTTTPETRWSLWTKTAAMIADSPLYGVGLGNFRPVFEREYHPELANDQRRGVHAHNLWLQQAAEIGIPGGLALAALWIAILSLAWRNARHERTFSNLALWLALAGAAVSNLTDGVPYQVLGVRVYVLYWVLFGLAAAEEPTSKRRSVRLQADRA